MKPTIEFPTTNKPEIIEKSQLLEIAGKLVVQSPSGEILPSGVVAAHLKMLADMAENIRADGLELLIDDVSIDPDGASGRIETRVTSTQWPGVEGVTLTEDMFNNTQPFTDAYPDTSTLLQVYGAAKQKLFAQIGNTATAMLREGTLIFSGNNTETFHSNDQSLGKVA